MKLWQLFACWFAYAIGKKQGWLDPIGVPEWLVWASALVLVCVWIWVRSAGETINKDLAKKAASVARRET